MWFVLREKAGEVSLRRYYSTGKNILFCARTGPIAAKNTPNGVIGTQEKLEKIDPSPITMLVVKRRRIPPYSCKHRSMPKCLFYSLINEATLSDEEQRSYRLTIERLIFFRQI